MDDMKTYIAYFTCGTQIEVKVPGLLKAIQTAKTFKDMRGRALGDFFTAAPRGTTVSVPHIISVRIIGPQQLELRFGSIDFIQYNGGD